MQLVKTLTFSALFLAISTASQAEPGGGVTGRVLDMSSNQGTAVEPLYRTYDDGNEMGVRISHRYNQKLMMYGDFVQTDNDDLGDGDGFGAGVFYFLPETLDGFDVAARASYHSGSASRSGLEIRFDDGVLPNVSTNMDLTTLSAELLLSPVNPIQDNGLSWYAGIGVAKVDADFGVKSGTTTVNIAGVTGKNSETEITGSVGLVLPTNFGSVFAAVEYVDGSAYSLGARYSF
ncbi:MAG: hypothetical protein KTR35_19485 [Gammaproteobacteria bacterium]|nr:hypothetical protein [Gammaproteobacteria bacterium]